MMANEGGQGVGEVSESQRVGMRNAILTQCFGSLAILSFMNGIMLVYLNYQQVSASRTILYLSTIQITSLLVVVFAYLADCWGKKKLGVIGGWGQVLGYGVIGLSGFLEGRLAEWVMVLGIVVFAVAVNIFESCWFSLMSPVVPAGLRGRYWGKLRLSWQSLVIFFSVFCGWFLSDGASKGRYQLVLGALTLSSVLRMYFYVRIPELEKPEGRREGFWSVIGKTIRADRYMPFCAYVFLLSLFTLGIPTIFGMLEKKVLLFSDSQVVWLGGVGMFGSVVGYWLCGKAIDRFGTRPMFMICHVGFGVVLFLFMLRGLWPGELVYVVGVLHFVYGLMLAGSSVAVTSEMMMLIPPEHKSMSTSFCVLMLRGGPALSGILVAGALRIGFFAAEWELFGVSLSAYDSVLMLSGIMVWLLVVTLGQVPSVLGKVEGGPMMRQ